MAFSPSHRTQGEDSSLWQKSRAARRGGFALGSRRRNEEYCAKYAEFRQRRAKGKGARSARATFATGCKDEGEFDGRKLSKPKSRTTRRISGWTKPDTFGHSPPPPPIDVTPGRASACRISRGRRRGKRAYPAATTAASPPSLHPAPPPASARVFAHPQHAAPMPPTRDRQHI